MKDKAFLELVLLAERISWGRRIRQYSIRLGGKELEKIIAREPLDAAAAAARYAESLGKMAEAVAASDTLRLYERLLARYPTMMEGISDFSLAKMVGEAQGRGNQWAESLRGLIVEKRLYDLPLTKDAWAGLDNVRRAKAKRFKIAWDSPDLVTDLVDGQGLAVGDMNLVSKAMLVPPGRTKREPFAWFMLIGESKSLNVGELARGRKRAVGQHLWDWARLKTRGAYIRGEYYPPGNIFCEPVPRDAWAVKKAVVMAKDGTAREAELAKLPGYYTQFVAFAPESMTANQILQVAGQGIQIEMWPWPFTLEEADKFCQAIAELLGKG